MKNRTIITFTFLLISIFSFAQTPEKFSYQAIIRDTENNLLKNSTISMQITILQGSATGNPVYSETQTPTTNANGLICVQIGGKTGFDTISWVYGSYFIKTETDPTGGVDYTITGTSQLLSVPFALHAKTAESIKGGLAENDPLYNSSIASKITKEDTANWNHKLDIEVDGSTTNELQTLSVSNDTIYLSNGGFVKLPISQSNTYEVGDTAFGGIIFYVNAKGTHGLVAAKTDQAYDGNDESTLVDYNEASCCCSDVNRFDDQGQEYFDWRLPTLNEMGILQSYRDSETEDDILDILKFGKDGSNADYYWSFDVFIVNDAGTVSSYTDKSLTRRYYSMINDSRFRPKYEAIHFNTNVRCVRSF